MTRILDFVRKIEVNSRPTINPQLSITHSIMIKIRILVEWAIRRASQIGYRRRALSQIRSQKSTKSSNNALVIGNGPSYKKLDIETLNLISRKQVNVFCINFFPLINENENIQPNYLVLSDPITRPTNKDEMTSRLWDWISRHPQVKLCVPISWKRELDRVLKNPAEILFFDDSCLYGWTKNISPVKARSYVSSTVYKALSISLFLGFENVYIIGIDNSQFKTLTVSDENQIIQKPNHFSTYANETTLNEHFPKGVGDYFYDVSVLFLDLFKFKDSRIINLDSESLIDAFSKQKSIVPNSNDDALNEI